MHNATWFSIPLCLRCLLISTLFVSAITLLPEINPAVSYASGSEVERRSVASMESSYGWNLSNDAQPLINLPDHISGALDFSLTYSLGQFEFPLLQSLYFNDRAGKYILMVITKERRNSGQPSAPNQRAEFIDLNRVKGLDQFAANGSLGWRLSDHGKVKLLTTSEGIVYTFASLADGELHCSQIRDHNEVIISLEYTSDSSVQKIADARGRSINFSYKNHSLSAITQNWNVNSAKLKQTWVVADEVSYAHRPAAYTGLVGAANAKHIPANAIRPVYTAAMSASDLGLAGIFGGPGAIAAANGFEPVKLGSQYPLYRGDLMGDDGKVRQGHLSLAMHLYGSEDGTSETEVYVPAGFTSHSRGPSPTDAVVTFYYPRLGHLTDVTLAVFHVANFELIYKPGRVRIGHIGGPGGSAAYYKHSHLEFYRGDTGLPSLAARTDLRIDPATIFTPSVALMR